ncbi:F-box domain containing protein, partial [Tanacetum coccineum]
MGLRYPYPLPMGAIPILYGLQQYLPDEFAKPIIKLCSFFRQICFATLIEDDMLKAQSKVVDILCNLELIYPPAFFDIMIHLVIHLPLEALEGGPIPNRDERRTTQNSGICSPGGNDGEMYYGQLQEILEFSYLSFKVVLFRVKWFDTRNEGRKVQRNVIHFDNSSDLPLSTSLNDLNNVTLHIDGQSTVVDAPPDIIDVPDEDADIIGDEDALPHDLADSDAEDLINVDD